MSAREIIGPFVNAAFLTASAGILWSLGLGLFWQPRWKSGPRWLRIESAIGFASYGAAAGIALAFILVLLPMEWTNSSVALTASGWVTALALLARIGNGTGEPTVPHLVTGLGLILLIYAASVGIDIWSDRVGGFLSF